MRLNTLSSFLTALALRILPSHGFPIAFSEHKLEEINALRAEGISEVSLTLLIKSSPSYYLVNERPLTFSFNVTISNADT